MSYKIISMAQEMSRTKKRIVIIGGTLETSFHPIPPIADGAPEWNVFRLAEASARNTEGKLDVHVISPCDSAQWKALQTYPVYARDNYHYILFDQLKLNAYRKVLRHLMPMRFLLRHWVNLPDLISWWYLLKVVEFLDEVRPNFVVINDRPQYIAYLRAKFPKLCLYYMNRAQIGESRRFLKLLDGIIVNSRGMGDYIGQFIKPGNPPVWCVPNALADEFTPPESDLDRFTRQDKTILFAGRLIPGKGAREVLLAFGHILEQVPSVKLVLCGAVSNQPSHVGYTAYERELHFLASQYPPGSVSFVGYIPNREMAAYYASANVAVFPSLPNFLESFGMVALEAMRCGTPVVASHQPGFKELILPGETGFLVDDPRDARSLASVIVSVLQDPDRAKRIGQSAYQHSLHYNINDALLAFEKIFTSEHNRFE